MVERLQGERMPPTGPGVPAHSPALYGVRVTGALDEAWCELMEGMSLTVLEREVPGGDCDQRRRARPAALAGLLDSLFRLNSTVLSVEALDA